MSHSHKHKHRHDKHKSRHDKKKEKEEKVRLFASVFANAIGHSMKPKNRPRGKPFAKGNKIGHRFKPGESGNPEGRSKFKKGTDAIRHLLSSEIPGDPHGRTFAEGIVESLGVKALLGDRACAAELMDRAEGRAVQGIAITEGGDGIKTLLAEMGKRSKKAGQPEEEEED
jgi:Family of unknown function (DUF5681)